MLALHPLETAASIIGVIVGAIIVLTIFFKLLDWLIRKFSGSPARVTFRGLIDEQTLATVHLTNGVLIERVRIVGFTRSDSSKGPFPYELTHMVILEHPDGRRTLIQAKMIRMIELPAAND